MMIQNKYTKATIIALITSSGLSFVLLFIVLGQGTELSNTGSSEWSLILLVSLGILINLFLAYKIYRGRVVFVKIAFWLYVLQILSLETPDHALSLMLGSSFSVTWLFGDVSFTLNLFAVAMSILIFTAIRSETQTK